MRPSLNAGRARHMEVRWHWLQHQVAGGQVRLLHLTTDWQLADLFTKALPKKRHQFLTEMIQGDQSAYSGEIRRTLYAYNKTLGNLTEAKVDDPTNTSGQTQLESALGSDAEGNYIADVNTKMEMAAALTENAEVLEALQTMNLAGPAAPNPDVTRQAEELINEGCPSITEHQDLLEETIALLEECHEHHYNQLVNHQTLILADMQRRADDRNATPLEAMHQEPRRRRGQEDGASQLPHDAPPPKRQAREQPEPSFGENYHMRNPDEAKRHDPSSIHYEGPRHEQIAVAEPEQIRPVIDADINNPARRAALPDSGAILGHNNERADGPDAERKVGRDDQYLGTSKLIPGNQSWSRFDTEATILDALGGARYPLAEATVAVIGKRARGKKFHDLQCQGLFCHTPKRYHAGVYITSAGEARRAGYTPCRICGNRLLQRRGG